jgi:hypothetical protein
VVQAAVERQRRTSLVGQSQQLPGRFSPNNAPLKRRLVQMVAAPHKVGNRSLVSQAWAVGHPTQRQEEGVGMVRMAQAAAAAVLESGEAKVAMGAMELW